jgi:lycopene beta-cyclase
MSRDFDYILVGGGLQNGLIALALVHRDPAVRLLLVEKQATLGGDHTWSFHDTDVPTHSRPWFEPLVSCRWPATEVRFPNFRRRLETGYGSILSNDFHRVITDRLAESPHAKVRLETEVSKIDPGEVTLAGGERISARWVIDSRGPVSQARGSGYQKFVGWEIELAEGLFPLHPVVMDSLVPQRDGYRFIYVLPFTRTRGLVEDTSFSSSPSLDRAAMRKAIVDYLHDQGWVVGRVIREESGVLPMPWARPASRLLPKDQVGLVHAGYRGGWFHPATGYSLPVAVRLAQAIADAPLGEPLERVIDRLQSDHAGQARFARFLNRLLFFGFEPADRWNVFERFYRFPVDMIERFYALRLTREDQKKLVCGRPPKQFSVRHFLLQQLVPKAIRRA